MNHVLTAKASGLTPFSISDTHSDSVLRSRWVFCVAIRLIYWKQGQQGTRTRRSEISESMSMTSRAAWRLEVISALGIVVWWSLESGVH